MTRYLVPLVGWRTLSGNNGTGWLCNATLCEFVRCICSFAKDRLLSSDSYSLPSALRILGAGSSGPEMEIADCEENTVIVTLSV